MPQANEQESWCRLYSTSPSQSMLETVCLGFRPAFLKSQEHLWFCARVCSVQEMDVFQMLYHNCAFEECEMESHLKFYKHIVIRKTFFFKWS